MTERIRTLHPDGKEGVNIEKVKYDKMKLAILKVLHDHGTVSLNDLQSKVTTRLTGKFEGSITWYLTVVKLDLEARGVIERVTDIKPHRLRLTN